MKTLEVIKGSKNKKIKRKKSSVFDVYLNLSEMG